MSSRLIASVFCKPVTASCTAFGVAAAPISGLEGGDRLPGGDPGTLAGAGEPLASVDVLSELVEAGADAVLESAVEDDPAAGLSSAKAGTVNTIPNASNAVP